MAMRTLSRGQGPSGGIAGTFLGRCEVLWPLVFSRRGEAGGRLRREEMLWRSRRAVALAPSRLLKKSEFSWRWAVHAEFADRKIRTYINATNFFSSLPSGRGPG